MPGTLEQAQALSDIGRGSVVRHAGIAFPEGLSSVVLPANPRLPLPLSARP